MLPQFWEWRILDVPRFYLWVLPVIVFQLRRGLEGSLKSAAKRDDQNPTDLMSLAKPN
jgi:hypothetical protein